MRRCSRTNSLLPVTVDSFPTVTVLAHSERYLSTVNVTTRLLLVLLVLVLRTVLCSPAARSVSAVVCRICILYSNTTKDRGTHSFFLSSHFGDRHLFIYFLTGGGKKTSKYSFVCVCVDMEFSRFLFIFVIVLCILSIPSAVAESDEYEYDDEEETSATVTPGTSKQSMNSKENIRNLGTDEYEYEYEDEEVSAIPSDTPHFPNPANQRHDHNQQEQLDFDLPMTNGFIRHGGGLMKIGRPLVDEIYINETVEKYDCVRFVDSLVQIIDAQDDEEEAMNVTAQIHELKQKMDKVLQMANRAINAADGRSEDSAATADGTTRTVQPKNESQPTDHTDVNTKPQKRMSFREKQALRLQQRKEREIAREALRPKYRLGADCESLICASCKSIMDEFGQLVFNAIRDPKVRYVDQLTENFCGSKVIAVKYVDVVRDVCSAFEQENLGYKEAMVSAFEGLQRWDDANKLPKLAALKKNVICSWLLVNEFLV